MSKRKGNRVGLRLLAAALLAAMLTGGWVWWYLIHWQPDRTEFPVQGVEIGDPEGKVDFVAIKAIGADFAYLDASASAFARDTSFVTNLDAARAAKLQVGAVHRYDPCQPADKQAANFVTVVPRDQKMLPPAVDLSMLAENCPVKVRDAAVESELTTFINQVEAHTGVPVILKIAPEFEKRYRVAATINRNIWVERDRFQPDYAGRPWTLWTANTDLNNEATPGALRWVVMQP